MFILVTNMESFFLKYYFYNNYLIYNLIKL